MSWPYCEADGCHDSHTRQYAWTGTVTTSGTAVPLDSLLITMGDTVRSGGGWGERLCRAHALIYFGVA